MCHTDINVDFWTNIGTPWGAPTLEKHQKHYGFSPFSLYHFFAPRPSQGATFSTLWCTFASKWLPLSPLGSHFVCPFRPEWLPGDHLLTTWWPLGAPATKKCAKWSPKVTKTVHFDPQTMTNLIRMFLISWAIS